MTRGPVHVLGGPLDGGVYDLDFEPGALIELNSPAGVCTYQFGPSDADEATLSYIGVGPLDGRREEDERV